MADISKRVLQFHSEAETDDPFQLVSVRGSEYVSRPFRFHLELVSREKAIDFRGMLTEKCWLGIKQGASGGSQLLKYHGVLASFEQAEMGMDWVTYKATLMPSLWRVSMNQQSRVFLDKSVPEIVEAVLKDDWGFASDDYDLGGLEATYPARPYVVQYQESDLDFLSRLLEHEGIFYYFQHGTDRSKIVFGDSVNVYATIQGRTRIPYRPKSSQLTQADSLDAASSGDEWFRPPVINSVSRHQRVIPEKVVLRDYNDADPDGNMKGEADIPQGGFGTVYEYGNHYADKSDGDTYAAIRAQERKCRESVLVGMGDVKSFRVGAKFELERHYRSDFNDTYLITEVHHRARQGAEMEAGGSVTAIYENRFRGIPASLVFRPARVTRRPRIPGAMNARIDAGSPDTGHTDVDYAKLDDRGRYIVRLPFDAASKADGAASHSVRMSQPYAGGVIQRADASAWDPSADTRTGEGYGMHFPLHKGTEVLLTHIDGDPDRPVIAGAVPNPKTPGPVEGGASSNEMQAKIESAGGNTIILHDEKESEFVWIRSPKYVRLAADPESSHISIGDPSTIITEPEGAPQADPKNNEYFKGPGPRLLPMWHPTGSISQGYIHMKSAGDICIESEANFRQEVAGNAEWTAFSDTYDFNLGVYNQSITLGAEVELFGGFKGEGHVGGKVEVFGGIAAEVTISPLSYEFKRTFTISDSDGPELKAREHEEDKVEYDSALKAGRSIVREAPMIFLKAEGTPQKPPHFALRILKYLDNKILDLRGVYLELKNTPKRLKDVVTKVADFFKNKSPTFDEPSGAQGALITLKADVASITCKNKAGLVLTGDGNAILRGKDAVNTLAQTINIGDSKVHKINVGAKNKGKMAIMGMTIDMDGDTTIKSGGSTFKLTKTGIEINNVLKVQA